MDADISLEQTAAKAPLNQLLMRAIRTALYGLEADIMVAGAYNYQFKVNGYLRALNPEQGTFSPRYRIDGGMISNNSTLSAARILLEQPGDSGTLEIDIRRYTKPNALITGIEHLFSAGISSIGRRGSAITTQSIARSAAQISTQSIARWKTQLSISSIVLLGDGFVRYNFTAAPDSDWIVGDTFTAASCSNAANDGSWTIVRVNEDGGNNVVISNASAVAQSTAAGTADLDAWKYVYTNPVDTEFTAGEVATFASHSNAANDGAKTVYAINQGGNNIIVKSATLVAQGSAAGNVNVNRWKFGLPSSAATYGYFAVAEKIETSGHASGGNDGQLTITALDSGGNNIVAYNASGVAQAGSGGSINSLRWVYAFATDPSTSSNVVAGHSMWNSDATSSANRGEFVVKEINVASGLNVVVFNASGTAQVGAAGTMYTSRVKVKFGADQANITTDSRVTIHNTTKNSHTFGHIDGEHTVLEVNRGGGSNYNAVISKYLAAAVPGPCGRVTLESKSIFDTRPSVSISSYNGTWLNVSTNAVLNATRKIVPADTLLYMDLLNVPLGEPKNLTVQLI